jgi:hypothetical protein
MSVSSISSVPPSAPVKPPAPIEASEPKGPDVKVDGDGDDASASQPVQAPLPPGQGIRVNQIA